MTKQIRVAELENGNYYAFHGGMIVEIVRHGNDINGNPLYKVFPISHLIRRSKFATRNYINNSRPYWLVQSYNIYSDIITIIDDVMPGLFELDEPMGDGWRTVTYQY